jgi:hypothetical protein
MAIKTTVHGIKQKGDRKHFPLERHTNQKQGFIFVLWGILRNVEKTHFGWIIKQ